MYVLHTKRSFKCIKINIQLEKQPENESQIHYRISDNFTLKLSIPDIFCCVWLYCPARHIDYISR